ncbi:MAG TPA: zf-HC2 domain-containing protein [Steroidobacteraceae bacterium]|nr:zf-HC2 domain-containing protein [Steroidobacteraceae bacterium]
MKISTQSRKEHQETWEILPWYVNGRLDERDREGVDAHLHTCAACRIELKEQQRIYQAMTADGNVEHMPAAAFKRLQQRLDADSAIPPRSAALAALRPLGRPPWQGLMAASVAVMAIALALIGGVLWKQAQRHTAPADYYTVTTATPHPADEVIRAVFAPTITLSELQALLADTHLKIVAGPTEAGVYSLAMTSSQPVALSLKRLREQSSVRFAESTETVSRDTR